MPARIHFMARLARDSDRMHTLRSQRFSDFETCWPGRLNPCPAAVPGTQQPAHTEDVAWAERQEVEPHKSPTPRLPPSCGTEEKQLAMALEANLHLSRAMEHLTEAPLGGHESGAEPTRAVLESGPGQFADPKRQPFLMLDHPYAWQKRPPCNENAYEEAVNGGCWFPVGTAPCRSESFEHGGKCYRPIEARRTPRPSEDREPKP